MIIISSFNRNVSDILGSFIQLGRVARTVFPRVSTPFFKVLSLADKMQSGFLGGEIAGQVWYAGGVLMGLILWAFAMVWFAWAISSVSLGKFPFSMGWWAFTFPIGKFDVNMRMVKILLIGGIGVLATSTIALGKEFNSIVFNVFGTVSYSNEEFIS